MYVLYKHTSPSGKAYVGITSNYYKRCSMHRTSKKCPAFHAAIEKYGWENFTHEILFTDLTLEEANELETRTILEHNTMFPHGYNLTTGAGVRRQLPHTEEHKQKISQKLKGRKLSEERKLKNARRYTVTSPAGEIFDVVNLNAFCTAHNLNNGSMVNVARGHLRQYRGWLCSYCDD